MPRDDEPELPVDGVFHRVPKLFGEWFAGGHLSNYGVHTTRSPKWTGLSMGDRRITVSPVKWATEYERQNSQVTEQSLMRLVQEPYGHGKDDSTSMMR